MDPALLASLALIGTGVIVYLFRETVFWALLFGMFAPSQLSDTGHSILKGAGVFLVVEGALILLLT